MKNLKEKTKSFIAFCKDINKMPEYAEVLKNNRFEDNYLVSPTFIKNMENNQLLFNEIEN